MTKKKTNRQKRTLVGAICVAAVIMAGSTFAWFTSSDEVTNRLSANADYNVSIVESFTPPNNWIPGQEVKKDVYATNTGNIGAFVREDISGALTITKEKATPTKTANSIELSAEERYVMEAGSFLAYKPAASAKVLGDQIVIRPDDAEGTALTDFEPDVEGLYVFRRSIAVAGDRTEKFEYKGYYYDATGQKFYKISNLNVTPDATEDKAGDGIKTDGNLASASAGFYEEETKVINPVDLIYKNLNGTEGGYSGYTGKYLIATYDTGNYKAEAALASAAAAYDEAIHNYEYLTALVTAATAENTAAGSSGALGTATSDLSTAQTELDNAITALQVAQSTLNDAQVAYNDAVTANAYAKKQAYESKTRLFGASTATETDGMVTPNVYGTDTADGSLAKILKDANAVVTASGTDTDAERFNTELDNWVTANASTLGGRTRTGTGANALTVADLEKFKADLSTTDEKHDYYVASANAKIAQLNYDEEMVKLYGHKQGSETAKSDTAGANVYTATSLWGAYQAAKDNIDAAKDGSAAKTLGAETDAADANGSAWAKYNKAVADLATAQANYDAKYAAWVTAAEDAGVTQAKLDEVTAAKTAAEQAKTAALSAYNTASNDTALQESDGTLRIFIKLSDNVKTNAAGDLVDAATQWQMLPTADAEGNLANDKAVFYYTGILDAGETSSRLVESVELDKNATQDMYKSFDFDLNVALNSVQITYGDDQTTILADGTPSELDAIATLDDDTDIDTMVTWTKTTPSAP